MAPLGPSFGLQCWGLRVSPEALDSSLGQETAVAVWGHQPPPHSQPRPHRFRWRCWSDRLQMDSLHLHKEEMCYKL